jgi:hypothetical protein
MQFPAMSSPKGPVERSLNEYPSPACRLIPVAQMEEILESLERKDLRRRNWCDYNHARPACASRFQLFPGIVLGAGSSRLD